MSQGTNTFKLQKCICLTDQYSDVQPLEDVPSPWTLLSPRSTMEFNDLEGSWINEKHDLEKRIVELEARSAVIGMRSVESKAWSLEQQVVDIGVGSKMSTRHRRAHSNTRTKLAQYSNKACTHTARDKRYECKACSIQQHSAQAVPPFVPLKLTDEMLCMREQNGMGPLECCLL
eukprot:scaffold14917_cov19-Tisochrysis_lutea.AAC.2